MSFAFPVFFRRMKIRNPQYLRTDAPMLIAMNHPNAFMDPMTLSWYLFYPRTRFMARGDAFKKPLAAWALQSMGIVPIFRLRDGGYESVKKNLESFGIVYRLLDRKQKIIVFSEGLCVQERRIRPIQKGTAKMALSYLEQGGSDRLQIVPVCINYSTPSKFRGDVFLDVGRPILVKDMFEEYSEKPAVVTNRLTALVEGRMKELSPQLTHKENDVLIEQLQSVLKEQFLEEKTDDPNDLTNHQAYWYFITGRLNTLTEKDAQRMNEFRGTVDEYTAQLQKAGIRDAEIYHEAKLPHPTFMMFLLILGFPLYALGWVLNIFPYKRAQRIAVKKCKDIEFFASVHFGAWALMAILLFIFELLIVGLIFKSIAALLLYTAIKTVSGAFAIWYHSFRQKTRSYLRLLHTKKHDLPFYVSLQEKRQYIVRFVNEN
jgi:1-acyl-sn-glycerol-3-phosphate acyltransferase